MSEAKISSFIGGMNKDKDSIYLKESEYRHAENFTLYTNSDGTVGSLENSRGNKYSFTIPDVAAKGAVPAQSNLRIIGHGFIRDSIILFTCPEDETDKTGQIWKLVYNETPSVPTPTLQLIYHDFLDFSINHPIEALGFYESPTIQKIYFTDFNKPLRTCNIANPNLQSVDPNSFILLSDIEFSTPRITEVLSGGSYRAGKVQYAYQLYNLNGQESSFSPLSGLAHIVSDSDNNASSFGYQGDSLAAAANKSVKVVLDDLDTSFYGVRIVAIYYETLNQPPSVRLVYENVFNAPTLTIIDTGAIVLGSFTVDELASLGSVLFTCKSLTSKNNILLPANIKYSYFDIDFDARAYRFPFASGVTTVKDGGVADTLLYAGGQCLINNLPVPEEYDAENPDHYINKYQPGTNILGGSGPNVSYQFRCLEMVLDENDDNVNVKTYKTTQDWPVLLGDNRFTANNGYKDYASPINTSQFMGYHRDEIYRFGIVFFNKKGQRSFVKWIGDIKMPAISDRDGKPIYWTQNPAPTAQHDFSITFTKGGATYLNTLYVEFDVDLSSLPQAIQDDIAGYSIVRANRTANDRTILGQGVVNALNTFNNPVEKRPIWSSWGSMYKWVRQTNDLMFYSPEVVINKNLVANNGDRLVVAGGYVAADNESSGQYNNNQKHAIVIEPSYLSGEAYIAKYRSVAATNPSIGVNSVFGVVNAAQIVSVGVQEFGSVSGLFRNYSRSSETNANIKVGYAPSGLLVNLSTPIPNQAGMWSLNADEYRLLVNYKVSNTPYGGESYVARQALGYISCTHFNDNPLFNAANVDKVFGGDTFISYFDLLKLMQDSAPEGGQATKMAVLLYPIETSINLQLRYDTHWSAGFTDIKTNEIRALGATMWPSSYPTTYTDLYLYNTVYSQPDSVIPYIPRPVMFNANTIYDTRILASQNKTIGEIIDNWTRFLPSDFIDLHNKYGPINKIVNHSDKVVAFQDDGVAMISINERSLIQDADNAALVLGTGGILERYDYLSTMVGCQHQWSVLNSPNGLYCVDARRKKMIAISDQLGSISDVSGLYNYMRDNISGALSVSDNPHLGLGILGYCDPITNEAVMTMIQPEDDSFTVAYSEMARAFTSFYSFVSPQYMQCDNKILSVLRENGSGDKVYIHHFGERSQYYDNIYPSKVTLEANHDYASIKFFDSMIVNLESYSSSGFNLHSDFFNYVRARNDYQNSGYVGLIYDDNYKRKDRDYVLHIPRNAVRYDIATADNFDILDPANLDATRLFLERMRSHSLAVDFIYSNDNNNRINLKFIAFNYRQSIR